MNAPFTTLPGLLRHAVETHGKPAALGFKRDGRWQTISSSVLLDSVRRAGENLIAMGLRPGDRVGIAAESSPFWLMADLAALGAGAVTVPLFPNASREVLRHQIQDSGMRFLFAGTEELRESLRPLCGPAVRLLVLSPRQIRRGAVGPAWSLAEGSPAVAGEWDRLAAQVRPGDTATLIYTSGSTGAPKGVELTHGNLVSQVRGAGERFPLDPATDCALSFLPLAHVFERMTACFYLASGTSIYFAEDPTRVGDNLREVRPTVMTVVPRFLEKAAGRMRENAEKASPLLRPLALAALRRARERDPSGPPGWRDRLYGALVHRKVRKRLGGRMRLLISGSAPLEAALCRFFLNLGIELYEGYGLTECSPVLTVNYPGHRKLGTVGPAFPGVELRIAPDGEILARGPNVMKGYYHQPEATREILDAEGWLHTGDLGSLDEEGYLRLTGRKKEIFKSANGKYVAPLPIEQALASHPLVDAAMVIAEGRPFVTALIFPDCESLLALKAEWDRRSHEHGNSFLRSEPVQARFRAVVDAVNERLNPWERVRKFHVVESAPTIEGGELTPTLKLRRHAVEQKYKARIDALYAS